MVLNEIENYQDYSPSVVNSFRVALLFLVLKRVYSRRQQQNDHIFM